MNKDSFIIHLKTEDVYDDIVNDVEKIFDNLIMKSKSHSLQEKIKN